MKLFKYKRLTIIIVATLVLFSVIISILIPNNTNQPQKNNFSTTKKINKKINNIKVQVNYPLYDIENLDNYINEYINTTLTQDTALEKVKKLRLTTQQSLSMTNT